MSALAIGIGLGLPVSLITLRLLSADPDVPAVSLPAIAGMAVLGVLGAPAAYSSRSAVIGGTRIARRAGT